MNKNLIIIPTYNEVNNITELIDRITSVNREIHILFVDDNSPDGTGEVINDISKSNKNIQVISRPMKIGNHLDKI